MTDKIETGSQGENLAAEFFVEQGFKVVARNYRWKRAEIDLIVEKKDWLIFVEVKTRSSNSYGDPESFVSEYQRRLIYNAAEAYIFNTDWKGHVRFDIVSVRTGTNPEILHFEDAIHY